MYRHPCSKHPCSNIATLMLILLAGCGGSGSSSSTIQSGSGQNTTGQNTSGQSNTGQANTVGTGQTGTGQTQDTTLTMSCLPGYQCSGATVLKMENGVALTSSGVEVFGKSTSDLATPIADTTTASGLTLSSPGLAEVRLAKDANGTVSKVEMLLSKLGISWDGKTERPQIIETFSPTQGRNQIGADGTISSVALPDMSNLDFYDYALKAEAAAQGNYANNRYFPRSAPSRCPSNVSGPCPTTETAGLSFQNGNWRTAGTNPDTTDAVRLHEDGDIHAGNGQPDANGNPTTLPNASGFGEPFPGAKGYRSFNSQSFQYANMVQWMTQDTVLIDEWAHAGNEHSTNRRGIVAFGKVANPSSIPTSGTASYAGTVSGWYAASTNDDLVGFSGAATITIDFATRTAKVVVERPTANDATGRALPVQLNVSTSIGASGSGTTNYFTSPVDNGTLKGGVSARLFGPDSTIATVPAEVAGTFTLSSASGGQAALGGFIARKQ